MIGYLELACLEPLCEFSCHLLPKNANKKSIKHVKNVRKKCSKIGLDVLVCLVWKT